MKNKSSHAVPQAHDRFFKQMMSDMRTAREFFVTHLPEDILNQIDLDRIEIQSGSYVNDLRKESIADMVFKTKLLDYKDAFIHLIVDHQSIPDELMPFRTLKYTCNFIDQHLTNMKTKRIPLIIPLVVYHGQVPWKYSIDINDLVDAPEELTKKYFLKPLQLIDLNTIPDEILKQSARAGVMTMSLKYIFYRDLLAHLPKIFTLLKQLDQTMYDKKIIENVLVYIIDKGDVGDKEAYFDMVKKDFTREIGEKIMTISEQLRTEGKNEGFQIGVEKGIEKGIEKGKMEIVERLLAENLSLHFIEKITGLPLVKIKDIKNKLCTI